MAKATTRVCPEITEKYLSGRLTPPPLPFTAVHVTPGNTSGHLVVRGPSNQGLSSGAVITNWCQANILGNNLRLEFHVRSSSGLFGEMK